MEATRAAMVPKEVQTDITRENFDLKGATVEGQLNKIFDDLNVIGEEGDFLQFKD